MRKDVYTFHVYDRTTAIGKRVTKHSSSEARDFLVQVGKVTNARAKEVIFKVREFKHAFVNSTIPDVDYRQEDVGA
jgi:hypothetical protein